ncbi:MAG TPA: PQQ-dependent sugar dehydrogenase [Gemmatimonadales bacterium]|nr:PQQ-dependent sugar dehydrogenase [Gemmatimonadales bacterium]
MKRYLNTMSLSGCAGLAVAAFLTGVSCGSEPTASEPPEPASGLKLETISTAFNEPVFLTFAPGDPTRFFVVEKNGLIRIFENGAILPAPFLDLTAVTTKGSEQGLLGLAFAPGYETSGRFYVSYTTVGSTPGGKSVIARYHVSSDPKLADAASDTTILQVDQPYTNHNGGMIVFGPDGFLYVGFGDGGNAGDPQGHGQNRNDLLGSLLRIDVSGVAYTIPLDNPFVGSGGARGELWNYGLRNPWRFSFDRQTSELYIADVGQGSREEVDVQPAAGGGENYGWNTMEGFECYPPGSGCSTSGLTLPVVEYSHGTGCSITGGYVYRGTALPDIVGTYFYSDYCAGFLRSFKWQGGMVTEQQSWPDVPGNVTSFGEDSAGELYILTIQGGVYKLVAEP